MKIKILPKHIKYILGGVLGVVLFVVLSEWSQQHAELLKELTNQAGILGIASYVAIMATSIIFAPLGTGFLLPMAANSYGPIPAAMYSILGWTIGSMVAFWIARGFRRSKVNEAHFIHRLQSYEASIPKYRFYGLIVLLRMALPVDVLSYALGFVSQMSSKAFFVTTVVGIAPLAFVFTFASTATVGVQLIVSILATLLFLTTSLWVYREYTQMSKQK
jgi:uncharacterized membrane protein YdjX (TVP38/TMEM64 family)